MPSSTRPRLSMILSRQNVGLLVVAGLAACAPKAEPLASPSPRLTSVETAVLVRRDSTGRVLDGGSTIIRRMQAETDSVNARVRVLRVEPDVVVAKVGDTLDPSILLRITGIDSAGATVRRVVPAFGAFRPDSLVKRTDKGRWLLTAVGEATVTVRPMRFNQRLSTDTALVRTVRVLVLR